MKHKRSSPDGKVLLMSNLATAPAGRKPEMRALVAKALPRNLGLLAGCLCIRSLWWWSPVSGHGGAMCHAAMQVASHGKVIGTNGFMGSMVQSCRPQTKRGKMITNHNSLELPYTSSTSLKGFLSIYPGVFFESDRDVRSVGAAGAVSFAYLKRITELLTAFRK